MWWCEYCGPGDGEGKHARSCTRYFNNKIYYAGSRSPIMLAIPSRGSRKALADLHVKLVAADEVRKKTPWHERLPEVQDWYQRIRGV